MPSYTFVGPVTYDYRPFQMYPPSRLVAAIPYGHTVWRDSSGTWHDQYDPDPTLLAGATVVYPGGRENTVDDVAAEDLQVAGYGAGLTPPYPVGIVGVARVGYAYVS